MLTRLIIALLACLVVLPAAAIQPGPENTALKAAIETLRAGKELRINDQVIASSLVLPAFYERRNYTPAWTRADAVRQLLQVIDSIDADGLNPEDYHQATLRRLYTGYPYSDPAASAEYDILLTDSLIRLGYHLVAGKVDAEALDNNWNMADTIGDMETVLAMSEAIDKAGIPALIDRLRPGQPFYANLKRALARYRAIETSGGWPTIPAGATLKAGMDDERVAALKNRLHITGELNMAETDSTHFDVSLENAVKAFQERHGLQPDGVVGPATLEAMNVPVETRIGQIRVNLERARWVLHDLPDQFVLTDIAGFRVTLKRDGEDDWTTRAQVGKPYRMTPVFRDRIRYLEINPTWTVPPTILKNDILPRLARDPGYLEKKDMQVLKHDGTPVDPAGIDWNQYPGKPFPYLIRQNPGPGNALGRIKFMFPNKHAVYLHDTPNRSLFNRDQRAFSSGCIRIEDPFDFAVLLLDDPQWDRQRLEQVVKSSQTTTVRLREPVTVLLLYWTVDVTDRGVPIFKPDIYERDPAVLAGLDKPFSFRKSPVLDSQAASARPGNLTAPH